MHVEVNEKNIKLYKLDEVTGNSVEFLREKVAEALSSNHILVVDLPDELVIEQNVFDVYETEAVDPRRLVCRYTTKKDGLKTVYICLNHNEQSKYDIEHYPDKPCLAVEPLEVPKLDNFSGMNCVYTTLKTTSGGVERICAVHGKPSMYDVALYPGASCLAVDSD